MPCLDTLAASRWLRLSHILSNRTPAYGGGAGLNVGIVRSMDRGESCNALSLSFSNHLGSHVDAPRHFVADGKTVDEYAIGDWVFTRPFVAEIPAEEGEILDIARFEAALASCDDADLLLVRTGFEKKRTEESYWASSPAFAPELADYLKARLPSLAAIGMDTISISSSRHRELGRAAHGSFLGKGLRIFEDLALAAVPSLSQLKLVIALPLLFENADGAPCTIAALVD